MNRQTLPNSSHLIRKAVFPVAGLGTRFLPATKANPKEMMPIVDTPLIQFAVNEAIEAGITDLVFVTSSSKRAIEDHFDHNFELECRLAQRKEAALLEILEGILPKGVRCIYVRQPMALGLGHAILCAKEVIGSEPFAILLADDLISPTLFRKSSSLVGSEPIQAEKKLGSLGCLFHMIQKYEEVRSSILGVEKVPEERCDQYGMVGFEKAYSGELNRIHSIVEKPPRGSAPSQHAVVGRYILTPEIFNYLEQLSPGKNGEIQLTDAIANLLTTQSVYAYEFSGKRYDCGTKLGYLQAIVNFAIEHPEVGEAFKVVLQDLVSSHKLL